MRTGKPSRPEKAGRSDRDSKPVRAGRPVKSIKPERPDKMEKPGRPGAYGKSERTARPEKFERPGRGEKSERPERPDRPGRFEKPGKFSGPAKSEGPGRPARAGRPERTERPDRGGRPERPGKPERIGKPERTERPERAGNFDRPGKPDRDFKLSRTSLPDRTAKPKQVVRRGEKKEDPDLMRLNKYIANSGICSRREADRMIEAGAVSVNGQIVTELGIKVGPGDKVQYGDQTINREKPRYVLLNKPKGYITTVDDPEKRKTVMALVAGACKERIYPVGTAIRPACSCSPTTETSPRSSPIRGMA